MNMRGRARHSPLIHIGYLKWNRILFPQFCENGGKCGVREEGFFCTGVCVCVL